MEIRNVHVVLVRAGINAMAQNRRIETTMKAILITGGVVFFIALVAWTIYEMKNAYELPPDDPNF